MFDVVTFKPNSEADIEPSPAATLPRTAYNSQPTSPNKVVEQVEETLLDKDDEEWSLSNELPNNFIAIEEFHSSKFETKFGKSASKSLNAIQLMPPGWKRSIYVPFLAGKLPVCQDCKVYTLTRDVCRLSKGHEGLPWSTSWVCILTDSTVRKENDQGQEEFVDSNYTVTDLNGKYNFQNLFQGDFGMDAPVCLSCKNTNRTKTYCRGKRSHGAIPWNTSYVYVTLKKDVSMFEHDETVLTSDDLSVAVSHVMLVQASATSVASRRLDIMKPNSSNRRKKRSNNGDATGLSYSPKLGSSSMNAISIPDPNLHPFNPYVPSQPVVQPPAVVPPKPVTVVKSPTKKILPPSSLPPSPVMDPNLMGQMYGGEMIMMGAPMMLPLMMPPMDFSAMAAMNPAMGGMGMMGGMHPMGLMGGWNPMGRMGMPMGR
ncbi:hypothetical protein TL16_g09951 [Triparma laevis f. inornata]|uniref:Uncharacterized protein n=1 Tax=Triparma laevis f. inornata TaxID=1714386 RepID=A0A9W7EME9_9STRA|nr:hypothetical protein TL16_g09951 [Triparma laevis f. inornata]